MLTKGNRKLSNDMPIFNLPQALTCPGKTEWCIKKCYAQKAHKCYQKVVPEFRYNNYLLSLCDNFTELIIKKLKRMRKIKAIRVHESGDYYNQTYLNKWFEICKSLPKLAFYCYTKSFHLDFKDKPDNLTCYASIDFTTSRDALNRAQELVQAKQFAGLALMGSPTHPQAPEGYYECQGSCKTCSYCFETKGNVYFHLH